MTREVAVILALAALAVAALCVSIGSFVLLWADRRVRRDLNSKGSRAGGSGEPEPPAPRD